jgi:hypothetical protein
MLKQRQVLASLLLAGAVVFVLGLGALAQSVSLTVTAYSDAVRFSAQGSVKELRVEILSLSGQKVFDSGPVLGNALDWKLSNTQGQPVANGVYLYTVTVKDPSGNVTKKLGKLAVLRGKGMAAPPLTLPTVGQVARTQPSWTNCAPPCNEVHLGSVTIATAGGENWATFDSGNQRFGVGTLSPTNRIHVVDTATPAAFTRVAAGSGDNRNAFLLERDNTGAMANDAVAFTFRLRRGDGTYINVAGARGVLEDPSGTGAGAFAFSTKGVGDVFEVERMRLTSTGNLGIGTKTPNEKLRIKGSGNQEVAVMLENTDALAAGGMRLEGTPDRLIIGTFGDVPLQFLTNATTRMTIAAPGGNVGIGIEPDPDPQVRLRVGGNVRISSFLQLDGGTLPPAAPAGTARLAMDSATNTLRFSQNGGPFREIQARVTGTCAAGQAIQVINADGTVTCENVGGAAAWSLTGNAITAGQFLGTTNNMALNIRVNNARAMSFEPNPISPNIIGGFSGNSVTSGVVGATIGGGGASTNPNRVTDNYGTVGGGYNNQAGDDAGTTSDRPYATVGGGESNTASGLNATVGGGRLNTAFGPYATVGGGNGNAAVGFNATVGGGYLNTASGDSATVGGGNSNIANAGQATVGGGANNSASGLSATVAGGSNNVADGWGATVGGGIVNIAGGQFATVAGGSGNIANGDYSFVVGRRARNSNPAHDGVFLFADSTDDNADFDSIAANEFAVRASGGFRFRTSADLSTGCNLPAGSGTFSCTSDRNVKENFRALDGRAILHKLSLIPITEWNYKGQGPTIRHIGPMAQDFYAAFGLGESDTTISTVDADGIALISIQALYQMSLEKDKQIEQLTQEIEELRASNAALQERLEALEKLVKELMPKK